MSKLRGLVMASAAIIGLLTGATVTASADPVSAKAHTDWTTPIGVLKASGKGKCSGSVVHSGHHNVVMTAAHCVNGANKDKLSFWPHFRNGDQDPVYGIWYVQQIIVPDQYKSWDRTHPKPAHSHKTNPYDYAFLIMKPYKGQNIEDRTGSLYPKPKINAHQTPVTISGYDAGARNRSQCIGRADGYNYQGNWYVQVKCPNAPMRGGTSGSPFIENGTFNVIGLTGGFQEGGDSDYVNYSAWFQDTFIYWYNRAKR